MFTPILAAADFGAPPAVIAAIVLIVLGLLILRFVIKTAITIVKVGLLVAIGVATYVGLAYVFG